MCHSCWPILIRSRSEPWEPYRAIPQGNPAGGRWPASYPLQGPDPPGAGAQHGCMLCITLCTTCCMPLEQLGKVCTVLSCLNGMQHVVHGVMHPGRMQGGAMLHCPHAAV